MASCRLYRHESGTNTRPLPDIPVYEITPRDSASATIVRSRSRDPLANVASSKIVSLTASNADARTLLLWLAEQAGVSLVIAPDVRARVSVTFTNVPAVQALRAVMAEAGLSVLTSSLQRPWPPVVFFELPMDVNKLSADAIVARFGVSMEMARFIVESRPE